MSESRNSLRPLLVVASAMRRHPRVAAVPARNLR
jgi:hypothetical protein